MKCQALLNLTRNYNDKYVPTDLDMLPSLVSTVFKKDSDNISNANPDNWLYIVTEKHIDQSSSPTKTPVFSASDAQSLIDKAFKDKDEGSPSKKPKK